jgi:hypothetical protein
VILFLDYDGVLHDGEVYLIDGKAVLKSSDPKKSFFEYVLLLEQALEAHPDIQIVLSTTWVPQFGLDEAKASLPESLQQRVIGATWHSHVGFSKDAWTTFTRYGQIDEYVIRHQITQWIAVDDDAYGWPDEKRAHLVHCADSFLGISDKCTYARLVDALAQR